MILFLNSCTMQSKELKAMLENPISTTELTTGHVISRSYQDKGMTLGKPEPAEVRIEYKPKDSYTENDVYSELVKILNQDNWDIDDLNSSQPGFFRASLPQDGFLIKATVNIRSERNIVSIRLRSMTR